MQQTIIAKYDNSRRVKSAGLFGCSVSTLQQRDMSKQTSNTLKESLRNPEMLKVEQIFTKVNEAFLQRHQLSKVLVNDIHENEIQLQFLEHQIRDQFDLNVKQSAALSMTTHSMIEVGATVLDFGTGDAATLKKSFDSLQDQANQSHTIADTMLEEICALSSIECALAESICIIKSQIQKIDARLIEENETAIALNLELLTLALEKKEMTSKLADTVKAISVSEEKFSLACKELYDIHVDLKTFNETISNEQHIISQLMVDADSEGIVGANVRMSEKIIDDVRSLQQNTALSERVLAQVQSSTEDCVAEVSQLQLLLNAINDQIDRHQRRLISSSTRLDDLRLKRLNLEQKSVTIHTETISLEELLNLCVREKNDAEQKAIQTAEENELNYTNTCLLMRELKDLNEVGPKLVQQLYELEESLSSKLSALDANELTLSNSTGETTTKLRVQRLLLEDSECQLKNNQDELSANRELLQKDKAIVESLQICIQENEFAQAQLEKDIEMLNGKSLLLDASSLQLSKLNDLLDRKRKDLALIVKETVTERAKLFSLRNDAPLLLENGLPEDVAAAMNVEIEKEWTVVAEEMNKAHNSEVYEMEVMLQQLKAGFPTTDGSEQLEDISRLSAEIERIESRLPLLRDAILEADARKQRWILQHAERRSIIRNSKNAESSQRRSSSKTENLQHCTHAEEALVTTLAYDDHIAPSCQEDSQVLDGNMTKTATAAGIDPHTNESNYLSENGGGNALNSAETIGKPYVAAAVIRKKTIQVHLPLFTNNTLDDEMDNVSHFSLFADKPHSPPEMNFGRTPYSSNLEARFKQGRLAEGGKNFSQERKATAEPATATATAKAPVQPTQRKSAQQSSSESYRQDSSLHSHRPTQKSDVVRVSALPKGVHSRKFSVIGSRAATELKEKKPAIALPGQSSPGDWFNVDDSF